MSSSQEVASSRPVRAAERLPGHMNRYIWSQLTEQCLLVCGHLCHLPSPVVKCQTRLWAQPSVIYSPFSSFTLFSSGLKSSECEGKYHLFLHSAISPQSASGPDAFVETRTFSSNHPGRGRSRLRMPAVCLRRAFYRKCEPVCDWSIHGTLVFLANHRRSLISGSAKEILCFCAVVCVRKGKLVFFIWAIIDLKYLSYWSVLFILTGFCSRKWTYKKCKSHPFLKPYIKATCHANGIFHRHRFGETAKRNNIETF